MELPTTTRCDRDYLRVNGIWNHECNYLRTTGVIDNGLQQDGELGYVGIDGGVPHAARAGAILALCLAGLGKLQFGDQLF